MNISQSTKRELLDLLLQIRNPESIAIAPHFDPNYKYLLMDDGTYLHKRRTHLSDGQLN